MYVPRPPPPFSRFCKVEVVSSQSVFLCGRLCVAQEVVSSQGVFLCELPLSANDPFLCCARSCLFVGATPSGSALSGRQGSLRWVAFSAKTKQWILDSRTGRTFAAMGDSPSATSSSRSTSPTRPNAVWMARGPLWEPPAAPLSRPFGATVSVQITPAADPPFFLDDFTSASRCFSASTSTLVSLHTEVRAPPERVGSFPQARLCGNRGVSQKQTLSLTSCS